MKCKSCGSKELNVCTKDCGTNKEPHFVCWECGATFTTTPKEISNFRFGKA